MKVQTFKQKKKLRSLRPQYRLTERYATTIHGEHVGERKTEGPGRAEARKAKRALGRNKPPMGTRRSKRRAKNSAAKLARKRGK